MSGWGSTYKPYSDPLTTWRNRYNNKYICMYCKTEGAAAFDSGDSPEQYLCKACTKWLDKEVSRAEDAAIAREQAAAERD